MKDKILKNIVNSERLVLGPNIITSKKGDAITVAYAFYDEEAEHPRWDIFTQNLGIAICLGKDSGDMYQDVVKVYPALKSWPFNYVVKPDIMAALYAIAMNEDETFAQKNEIETQSIGAAFQAIKYKHGTIFGITKDFEKINIIDEKTFFTEKYDNFLGFIFASEIMVKKYFQLDTWNASLAKRQLEKEISTMKDFFNNERYEVVIDTFAVVNNEYMLMRTDSEAGIIGKNLANEKLSSIKALSDNEAKSLCEEYLAEAGPQP